MFTFIFDLLEMLVRWFIIRLTYFLPVKVIRHKGRPFLYRYHLFALTNDGPGICIHHFVKSDPDRGYHDHPHSYALSFILCGGYDERILNDDLKTYNVRHRGRWNFNYLRGEGVYHRVMIDEGKDAWTIFFFGKRSKTWGMIDLKGEYHEMSSTIHDKDGGWWRHVIHGIGLHQRLEHKGKIWLCVDIIVIAENKVMLIERGKDPFKGCYALVGGRCEAKDKDILEAAKRELKEETHLENVELKYMTTVGNNTRDVRGFTATCVYLAKLDKIPDDDHVYAGDDAVDLQWFDLNQLPNMAFDHKEILNDVLKMESN